MTNDTIQLASSVVLPLRVLGLTQTLLATKGAGKTWGMLLMMEQVAAAGLPFVGIDPTGVMWGLKYSRTGKSASDVGVLVFGGNEADLPIEAESGAVVARFVAESGHRVVLDTSLMSKSARHRFMADFLETLYHVKARKEHRGNLHIFWDETHEAAPQTPKAEQARVLGAAQDIVTKGRSRGLGMTMVTQRPARLHKDLLDLSDVLYVMRTIGPRDWRAIEDFVKAAGGDKVRGELADERARLKKGEAFIWSPEALADDEGNALFRRFRFGEGIGGAGARTTFDSSKTPEPGEDVIRPTASVSIDLDALSAEIKATAERAKADDPAELRKQIAALKKQIAELEQRPAEEKVIEVPAIDEETLAEIRVYAGEIAAHMENDVLHEELAQAASRHGQFRDGAAKLLEQLQGLQAGPVHRKLVQNSSTAPAPKQRAVTCSTTTNTTATPSAEHPDVNKPRQKILDALAWFEAVGIGQASRTLVAAIAGVSPRSSGFEKNVSTLSSGGLIQYPTAGDLQLTGKGRSAANVPSAPPTLESLHQRWLDSPAVTGPQRRILEELIEAGPDGVWTREEIAAAVDSSARSSGFEKNISRLSSLGLIRYPQPGSLQPTDLLFPEGLT